MKLETRPQLLRGCWRGVVGGRWLVLEGLVVMLMRRRRRKERRGMCGARSLVMDMMGWWIYLPVGERLAASADLLEARVCMVWA